MTQPSVLTVTFNPALDKFVWGNQCAREKEYRVKKISLSAGGKGLNVSRAFKNLGGDALATGFIGGPAGARIVQILCGEKIAFDFVPIKKESRTNHTILDAHGQVMRFLEPGPAVSSAEARVFFKKFKAYLPRVDAVVFSGQLPPGLKQSFFLCLLRCAAKRGKKVFIDTSGTALKAALNARPYFIKPNLQEAECVLGRRLKGIQKLKTALNCFLRQGAGCAVISLGADGGVASDGNGFWQAQVPFQKNAVQNVGCGDALVAGFIFADQKSFDFPKAFCFAVACGTANLSTKVPGAICKQRVEQLFKKIRLKVLD